MLVVFVAITCLAREGLAWSGGGHKVVALIAYSQLSSTERAKVIEVLQHHPLWENDFEEELDDDIGDAPQTQQAMWLFAQAAVWPDIARKYTHPPKNYHRESWHYINRPIYLDQASRDALKDHLPNQDTKYQQGMNLENMNAPQAIDLALQVLRKVGGTQDEKANKAIMLCWLIHLVGDLHQPLHCAALFAKDTFPGGDHGGNYVLLPKAPNQKKPENLHSFWDHLHGGTAQLNAAGATVNSIMKEPGMVGKARTAAQNLSVESWVSEGQKIAMEKAYIKRIVDAAKAAELTPANERKVEVFFTPAERKAYGKAMGTIASERAAIGGYRLAELLKTIQP